MHNLKDRFCIKFVDGADRLIYPIASHTARIIKVLNCLLIPSENPECLDYYNTAVLLVTLYDSALLLGCLCYPSWLARSWAVFNSTDNKLCNTKQELNGRKIILDILEYLQCAWRKICANSITLPYFAAVFVYCCTF